MTYTLCQTIDEAIAEANKHANPDWKEIAFRIVRELCETREEFSTDDVWAKLDRTMAITHEPRALGAIVLKACKAGLCANTGMYRKTTRPEAHKRPIPVWRSNLFPLAA